MTIEATTRMHASLPLFPDLLELSDQFGRSADYLTRGHGVWSFLDGARYRRRDDVGSQATHLFVLYSDQRYRVEKDGLRWTVELRRYINWYPPERGKKRREMCQRVRCIERRFATREEAIQLAEKLLAVFRRVKGVHRGE